MAKIIKKKIRNKNSSVKVIYTFILRHKINEVLTLKNSCSEIKWISLLEVPMNLSVLCAVKPVSIIQDSWTLFQDRDARKKGK